MFTTALILSHMNPIHTLPTCFLEKRKENLVTALIKLNYRRQPQNMQQKKCSNTCKKTEGKYSVTRYISRQEHFMTACYHIIHIHT
jgi:hypothetical protein